MYTSISSTAEGGHAIVTVAGPSGSSWTCVGQLGLASWRLGDLRRDAGQRHLPWCDAREIGRDSSVNLAKNRFVPENRTDAIGFGQLQAHQPGGEYIGN